MFRTKNNLMIKEKKHNTPLDKMILNVVGCVKCGAPYGKCDCWTKCSTCGWLYAKDTQCTNPECKNKIK